MKLKNRMFGLAVRNEQLAKLLAFNLKKVNGHFKKGNILLIHSGRCGSTVLGALLNQHPKIKWSGEIFTSFKGKYPGINWIVSNPKLLRDIRIYGNQYPYFGFELKFPNFHMFSRKKNMSYRSFFNEMADQEIDYVIILERKNYLKKLISMRTGKSLGRWNFKKSIHKDLPKIEINTEEVYRGLNLIDFFYHLRDFYQLIREEVTKSNKSSLYLTYEDHILNSPLVAYRKICSQIGVPPSKAEVEHKKINKHPIKDRIQNFHEVKTQLQNTEFSWMLDS